MPFGFEFSADSDAVFESVPEGSAMAELKALSTAFGQWSG